MSVSNVSSCIEHVPMFQENKKHPRQELNTEKKSTIKKRCTEATNQHPVMTSNY